MKKMRTIPIIPEKETRCLSLNLALVPLQQAIALAERLNFDPELVRIVYKEHTEYHLLLWQGAIGDTPSDLDDRIDAIADEVAPRAIRHAFQTKRTKDTWVIYAVMDSDEVGWEQRLLMPSGSVTEIISESFYPSNSSVQLPTVGDRVVEYANLVDENEGVTHSREGDWIVVKTEVFSGENKNILVCRCKWSPIDPK
jgi:hypothetical protein